MRSICIGLTLELEAKVISVRLPNGGVVEGFLRINHHQMVVHFDLRYHIFYVSILEFWCYAHLIKSSQVRDKPKLLRSLLRCHFNPDKHLGVYAHFSIVPEISKSLISEDTKTRLFADMG